MKATFFLLACFLVGASLGGNTVMFSADAVIRVPNGQYTGKAYYYYDEEEQYLRIDYSTPSSMIELIDYKEGVRYKVGYKCEAAYYGYPAPTLFKNIGDTSTEITEDGCTKYIPADKAGLDSVWLTDTETICKAELINGKTIQFSNVNYMFNDMNFFSIAGKQCPVPVCKRAIDVVLAVDSSDPVGEDNWNNYVKEFVRQLASSLDIYHDAAQIGVVSFGTTAREIIGLSSNKALIEEVLALAKYTGGDTCIGCGINMAMDMLKNMDTHRTRLNPNKFIIVVAGGDNNASDPNNTCAGYKPECTARDASKCIQYGCSGSYRTVNTSICKKYEEDRSKCKNGDVKHAKIINGVLNVLA